MDKGREMMGWLSFDMNRRSRDMKAEKTKAAKGGLRSGKKLGASTGLNMVEERVNV